MNTYINTLMPLFETSLAHGAPKRFMQRRIISCDNCRRRLTIFRKCQGKAFKKFAKK